MLITKKVLISDVILRVTQGKPSTELELEQSQIAFILDQVRWGLITAKINAQIQKNYPIDPAYIFTETNLVPQLINTPGLPIQNNIGFQLQYKPLNIYRDRGVIRVFAVPIQSTITLSNLQLPIDYGSVVDMVSASEIDDLNGLRFSKPSLKNMKFRREGDMLYIFGLDVNTYQMVKFTVTYFPRISLLEDLNDEDEVPLTEDIYKPLIEEATTTAMAQIYNSGTDIRNDAIQNQSPAQVNK